MDGTYWLKSPLLNDGVNDLLIRHQSPPLCEVVLRVLLRHTAHAGNICEYFLVEMLDGNILWKSLVKILGGHVW